METGTIGEKLEEIRQTLMEAKNLRFMDLAKTSANLFELALSFLAVLELARVGFLRLYQDPENDSSGPRLFLAASKATVSSEAELDYR